VITVEHLELLREFLTQQEAEQRAAQVDWVQVARSRHADIRDVAGVVPGAVMLEILSKVTAQLSPPSDPPAETAGQSSGGSSSEPRYVRATAESVRCAPDRRVLDGFGGCYRGGVVGRPAPARSSRRRRSSASFASFEVGYLSTSVRKARRPWTLSLTS
jgi:hypothetical protein